MSASFTTGTWVLQPTENGTRIIAQRDDDPRFKRVIAIMASTNPGDGALVSACPDLLAATLAMMAELSEHDPNSPGLYLARQAVTKARVS